MMKVAKIAASTVFNLKTAIIGAGCGGLAALKTCLDEGMKPDVFEKSGLIGGTWNFNEKTGLDEFGLPLNITTYEGMRTNVPKELMEFEGFPFKGIRKSYIDQQIVLKYIQDFADRFNLYPHIQFYKHIQNVDLLPQDRWKVTVRDLKSDKNEIKEYDVLIVCTGSITKPIIPEFKGLVKFQGTTKHSFNYKKSDPYKNKDVLVIGSGPSGSDITKLISKVANKVILCHRSPIHKCIKFPNNVKIKPEVDEFLENSVTFKDGTLENITDVLFCTGYNRDWAYLSKSCEIEVENNHVKYLYKQIINAKHPTMALLGIPYVTYLFTLYGIQTRFFLAFLKGEFTATEEEMIQDAIDFKKNREERGLSLVEANREYYNDISETAKIRNVPAVYENLRIYATNEGKEKFDECYEIINENEFKII